ncbi:alpha-N-arabinofuranosidase [Roseiterribacter gracilis]|uniref:non-reducing end alpha-L-arabinofuranosidase n=1 Tax=Roseiterribacter gracilis TaxID=2812848 RepID=A0A8S8XJ06_9PROT|nr:alpha-L-arabinofuranosidase [Rhodospirillales bacterium TMPK1]
MFKLMLVLLALGVPASAETMHADLVLHTDRPGAVIDPNLHGQFAEHLGEGMYGGLWVGETSLIPNTRGFRNDVVAALRDLGVPVVRWPGGCFADQYHWRDGIGPRDQRPVRINTSWGGVEESNAVGIHEFMDLAEQLGAKTYVNGNVGTGTPREMQDWIEYMTSDAPNGTLAQERRANGRDKPWRVDYVALGNELWECGGNMRPEFYADLYHQFATFVKTKDGNGPKKIAAGGYGDNVRWNEVLLRSNKKDIDAITMHHFSLPTGDWKKKGPATGFDEAHWMSVLRQALQMETLIAAHSAMMDRVDPNKKVALFVDEWSNWYDVDLGTNPGFLRQQNTLRDAISAAIVLNIFHAHADRVRMANITQMVNVLQAMVQTDGARMLLTPTYHVFRLFKPFRGATQIPVTRQAPPYRFGKDQIPALQAGAARTGDGHVQLALVNLDPHRAAQVALLTDAKEAAGQILTAATMDARNTFDAPDMVKPAPFTGARLAKGRLLLDLPAKSVVVLELR